MGAAQELKAVREEMQRAALGGNSVTVIETRILCHRLSLVEQLVALDEEELAGFRRAQFLRQGRAMVNELASEMLDTGLLEEGKVVHPDFGRKS